MNKRSIKTNPYISLICFLLVLENYGSFIHGQTLLPVRRLKLAEKYIVEWQVAPNSGSVTFEVFVETLGYVGFGMSPAGTMWDADIVIGWIAPNGSAYFEDHHGVGQTKPRVDLSQDYDLLAASQNETHTTLKFVRLLDTGDDEDFLISENTTNFIWSFGAADAKQYHGPNRGTAPVNLFSAS